MNASNTDAPQNPPPGESLRQSQKMEALGQLAAGVAHDFNNTLLSILMGLGMLRENHDLSLDAKESLREIERATARAINLTRQLLLFSRQQAPRMEPLDFKALIEELLNLLRRLLGENIEISLHCAPEEVWVNADARDGRFVCLTVSDTGCGMEEGVARRIFEPFFTTKDTGKGTGLGLATVYGIVKQHQGWVEVESAVGRGSSFRVYLPHVRAEQALALPGGEEEMEIKGGCESILLVEDDDFIRRLVAARLRELGYAVLEAGNGCEALEQWQKHRHKIELLFTDMMMPGTMTGLDLALQLKKEQPGLKVISSSGYSASLADSPLTADQEIDYLPKPYEPAALALTVRRCLDRRRWKGAEPE